MVKSTSNGTAKPANAESKVERSRLVLLGALAAGCKARWLAVRPAVSPVPDLLCAAGYPIPFALATKSARCGR